MPTISHLIKKTNDYLDKEIKSENIEKKVIVSGKSKGEQLIEALRSQVSTLLGGKDGLINPPKTQYSFPENKVRPPESTRNSTNVTEKIDVPGDFNAGQDPSGNSEMQEFLIGGNNRQASEIKRMSTKKIDINSLLARSNMFLNGLATK